MSEDQPSQKDIRRNPHQTIWRRIVPFILQTPSWPIARTLFWWSMHARYVGSQHVVEALTMRDQLRKEDGKLRGIIFASNHLSEFDPIMIRAGFSLIQYASPMFYVSAPMKDFRSGEYGWRNFLYKQELFFKAWGSYPLQPGTKNYAESLASHIDILNAGLPLTIFPEGGIKHKKPEGHGGVGYLIEHCDPIIIPVTITYEHLPGTFKQFFSRKAHSCITYGAPLTKKDLPAHSHDESIYQHRAKQIMKLIYN